MYVILLLYYSFVLTHARFARAAGDADVKTHINTLKVVAGDDKVILAALKNVEKNLKTGGAVPTLSELQERCKHVKERYEVARSEATSWECDTSGYCE